MAHVDLLARLAQIHMPHHSAHATTDVSRDGGKQPFYIFLPDQGLTTSVIDES